MMRVNLKILLIVVCIGVILATLSLWAKCGDPRVFSHKPFSDWSTKTSSHGETLRAEDAYLGGAGEKAGSELQGYEEIECHINGETRISCRKEGGEIYIPYSFLHKYFEVYGKLATYDGFERFEWSHSYSKVYYPKGKYDPKGVFMYFENYNVEVRDRVKCISATEGVPVSTQWESGGYYYPTQVAQFGLSHYSKNLTDPEPRRKILEDGDKETLEWSVPAGASVFRGQDPDVDSYVLQFTSPEFGTGSGIALQMDHVQDFILSMDLKMTSNGSFSITLQNREKRELFHLHYLCSDILITAEDHNIYHGMGCQPNKWHHLTRDLYVDLQKGQLFLNRKKKVTRLKLKVVGMTLRGSGSLDNLTLSTSEHMSQFYDAARWFVKHQDPHTGGWPNPVRRRVASGMKDLEPGWYSAMGQGHAISVLARAYHHSGNVWYLDAALKGLKPFFVASKDHGVLALYMDTYKWYEEYPTTPSSFVLNGFIYSLLGLYDVRVIAPSERAKDADLLFKEGMTSLKRMLLLYDTGSGTVYDLRHFTLRVAPNIARWDYHATHINQLLLLATIDKDPLLTTTAERWIGYMNGKRASHN